MIDTCFTPFQIFENKRVFVTGHTGFKGSWLSLWLAKLGCHVAGYAWEPPTNPSNFEVCSVATQIEKNIVADVRDFDQLSRAIAEFEPDLVMHLAAQSVVKKGYDQPLETFSTNVMGTANVLEAVRKYRKPCAVFCVTSDKCYYNKEQPWGYRESDEMGDLDPYGGSKGAAELVIRSFRESYFSVPQIDKHGVWLASGRAGNVVGGGDWTDHALVVDCINAFANNEVVEIRNPHAQRPWQHVLQCLSGYLTVASKLLEKQEPSVCTGWNFGPLPGNELPVQDVTRMISEFWGNGKWDVPNSPNHKREAQILRLAIDKAIWQLGWKPCWNVHQTLEKAVSWYLEYHSNPDSMREFSLQQINEYEMAMHTTAVKTEEQWA